MSSVGRWSSSATSASGADLKGAQDAFLEAHDHAWPPQPGLALLRMEEGDLDTAAQMVAAEIASPTMLPWKERPPIADLQVVAVLEAQVEIADAAGDATTAAAAVERLCSIAERYPTRGIRAGADLACALRLRRGDGAACARSGTQHGGEPRGSPTRVAVGSGRARSVRRTGGCPRSTHSSGPNDHCRGSPQRRSSSTATHGASVSVAEKRC